MRHASSAELRRVVDEPLAVSQKARVHLRSCEHCGHRQQQFAADAAVVERALPDLPAGDLGLDLAWARMRRRLEEARTPAAAPAQRHLHRRVSRRAVAFGVGGVVLLAATSAAAAEIVTVLSPTRVAPLELSQGDLSSILQALPSATLTQSDVGPPQAVASVRQADAQTGLHVELPTYVPTGVDPTPMLSVQPSVDFELTFGGNSSGRSVGGAEVPSWLVGTTLRIQAGPAVVATYPSRSGPDGLPGLVVGYSAPPVLTATGASPQRIEDFVLSQPGVSPALAAEIRVLGAPGSVIPVPIPAGASVSDVNVGGAQGVLLSDPSGFASGVIWESAKSVKVVGGLIARDQALQVANELG